MCLRLEELLKPELEKVLKLMQVVTSEAFKYKAHCSTVKVVFEALLIR